MMKILKKIFKKKYVKYIVLLMIIAAGISLYLLQREHLNTFEIQNQKLYQYLNGIRFNLDGHIKIYNDPKKKQSELYFDEYQIELDTTPLYYVDERKSIFPKQMSLVFPMINEQYKLNFFSFAYLDTSNLAYIQDGISNKNVSKAFIFDGNNLYYFLDYMKIMYNGSEHKLSPLSYVVMDYKSKTLEIYDYETDSYQMIDNVSDNVIVSNDDYSVNLSLDLFKFGDESKLLSKKIDALKTFK